MTAKRVSRIVSKIGAKAVVIVNGEGKPASARNFRRSFGTSWAKRVMPAVLQQLMRHQSVDTSLTYYVATDTDELADFLSATREGSDTEEVGNTRGNINRNGPQEGETGPGESSTEPVASVSVRSGGHGTPKTQADQPRGLRL